MIANPHLQRAELLMEQSRYELAEKELRLALIEAPSDAEAHALLALCLTRLKQFGSATQEAETAIGLDPELPFAYYAHAIVLAQRNYFSQAEAAIGRAIGLAPNNTQYYAHLARLRIEQRHWQDGLLVAEQGLALDPEDVECTNLRAMALARLGRRSEAGTAIETALKRDPENPDSHANMGWSLVENGQPQRALEHFREALRLDPESDWAREGIVEAMKARYWIYRLVLGWFLWMLSLRARTQWLVLIGAFLGFHALRYLAARNSSLAPWMMPLLIAYVAFALMTWLASPLSNLALRLNRFGRLALTREQTVTSNWVGLCVLSAVVAITTYLVGGNIDYLLCAITCALVVPPLAHIYSCAEGWPRVVMIEITLGLIFLALVILVSLPLSTALPPALARVLSITGHTAFLVLALGALAAQIAINALLHVQPRDAHITTAITWITGTILLGIAFILFMGYVGIISLAILAQTP
jgi:Flp pilus assembly protein TadD